MRIMETLKDMTGEAISRFYMMANFSKIMATPVENVSEEMLDSYAREHLPEFLKEELKEIDLGEAMKIIRQVNATVERVLAKNGIAEFPFWEESKDKDAHWYTFYEGGLEIFFDHNTPRWYKVYSAIYEFAEVANLIRNGDGITDAQMAYWILATVPEVHRLEFVRAKIAEARYKIALAEKEGGGEYATLRIGMQEEIIDFWAIIENQLIPEE